MNLKNDALSIINHAIKCSLPYENTAEKLKELASVSNSFTVFSIGKAAVPMAKAASDILGNKIRKGLCVTKYGHTGDFSSPFFEVIEAAHPVSDENSILAAEKALETAKELTADDTVIVLLSGGGSALFEKSVCSAEEQREITKKLLARGAEIEEINAVRKRLSLVKGGKFAAACSPARVITLALSDVLSNDKGVIASGITAADETTDDEIKKIISAYLTDIDKKTLDILLKSNKIDINCGDYCFVGDINSLCDSAADFARNLGYEVMCVKKNLTGEARDRAKELIGGVSPLPGKRAYIFGGETTVTLRGNGLGGRNQEMALAAALELNGRRGIVFASCGSDGTDGPTDAAGGIADGETCALMLAKGLTPEKELENNNSYYALKEADSLIITGPTGTNVNDITVILTDT